MTASTDREEPGPARLVDLAADASPAEWMALSSAAHWNQSEDDWRTMLALGRGWGLRQRDEAGRDVLAASTLVLPYEARFAWISMVLVLPAWRGHGFAARLLAVALQHLGSQGLLPVLDATPAGRPVYLKQGFVDAWGFERWRRKAGADADTSANPMPSRMRPLRDADWTAIEAFDRTAFGASRLPLLRSLAQRLPQVALITTDGSGEGRPSGYLVGRDGRTALQLGPLVAGDESAAIDLLATALAALHAGGRLRQRDIVVDLRTSQPALAAWLRAQGFEFERPFTRMVHGAQCKAPGDARRVVLVAGPELG